ncbi:MAG: arylsulfatase A-like enzyme [Planctomycetota bacterium]|jgi:arylsulfatase A-like enzyme
MTKVPLFFWGEGVRAKAHEDLVSTIDIYATICELVGLLRPVNQGLSIDPAIRAGEIELDRSFVLAECAGIRDEEGNKRP